MRLIGKPLRTSEASPKTCFSGRNSNGLLFRLRSRRPHRPSRLGAKPLAMPENGRKSQDRGLDAFALLTRIEAGTTPEPSQIVARLRRDWTYAARPYACLFACHSRVCACASCPNRNEVTRRPDGSRRFSGAEIHTCGIGRRRARHNTKTCTCVRRLLGRLRRGHHPRLYGHRNNKRHCKSSFNR